MKIVSKIKNEQMSLIKKYTNLASQYDDSISLAIGEPKFDVNKKIIDEAITSLQQNDKGYCNARGIPSLLNAISLKEKVETENILVTLGSTEALFITLMSLIDPLDEVIIITPSYPHYAPCVRYFGGVCKFLDTIDTDFEPTFNDLISLVTDKTKAIIINCPTNPTGIIYQNKTLKMIETIAKKNNICLICDDVYEDIVYIKDKVYKFNIDNCVYIKSLSKSYNMTGFRIGYLYSNKTMVETLLKVHSYLTISLPIFIQKAAALALTEIKPNLKDYLKNLNYCINTFDELQINYITPDGGIYIFININEFNKTSVEFCDDLFYSKHLACVPGIAFKTEGFIRINYCLKYEDLVLALDRFGDYINKLRYSN